MNFLMFTHRSKLLISFMVHFAIKCFHSNSIECAWYFSSYDGVYVSIYDTGDFWFETTISIKCWLGIFALFSTCLWHICLFYVEILVWCCLLGCLSNKCVLDIKLLRYQNNLRVICSNKSHSQTHTHINLISLPKIMQRKWQSVHLFNGK